VLCSSHHTSLIVLWCVVVLCSVVLCCAVCAVPCVVWCGVGRAPDDADNLLVPKLVEKLVLPALASDHIPSVWNPLSATHQSRLVAAVQDVVAHIVVEPGADAAKSSATKALGVLCQAIVQRLQAAVQAHAACPVVPIQKVRVF
jgi:hypothetical protein